MIMIMLHDHDVGNNKSMFALTVLEKIKKTRLIFS